MTPGRATSAAQTPPAPGAGGVFLCLAAECGLRFPASTEESSIGRCPRCGGGVVQVATVQARRVPCCVPAGEMPPLHLLLDNWRSLFNVGSIFRTADGAGVCEVHLCGITPTPAHPKLAKTALGAEATVAWSYAPDAVARAAALHAAGMQVWVLEGGAESVSLWACGPPQGRGLVLAAGNEVSGVDPGLVACADRVVHVPMVGCKGSLNVAVALSIAAYWLVGQAERRSGG
ncbi:MAG: TrmH family RNA methyltransferase [Caldilineaceae bacterium]|nr:TrmH family RNA methyltransferase [Caldilineaceae bacterium]